MEADVIKYLITYQASRLTDIERLAMRYLQYSESLSVYDSYTESSIIQMMKSQLDELSNNAQVLALLQDGPVAFRQRVAQRIYAENGGEVLLNNCLVCNHLARTPQAQQCRHCGSSWR